ncbi:MAG TPA: FadR/GntR family transcriptional regulator [Chitinophagaceae bacterium]|jgi:DNA-binding FadR family transcriptional regulator|nr:FadR/GntR family transcriptional regulator [Chitinophagaceae bacterium]
MMNESINNKIKRQRLADEVASRLRGQIVDGNYQSGGRLPSEPELMAAFGVGRSTIREAVRILAHSGLLRVQQGLGTFVEPPAGITEPLGQRLKRSQASELNEVRQLLEAKIAEKAATHRTAKDIDSMKSLLKKRMEVARSGDKTACIEADIRFHISIAEAAGNDMLADLYKTFAIQIRQSFQEVYTGTASFIKTHALHEALLRSIVNKNAREAWRRAKEITDKKE